MSRLPARLHPYLIRPLALRLLRPVELASPEFHFAMSLLYVVAARPELFRTRWPQIAQGEVDNVDPLFVERCYRVVQHVKANIERRNALLLKRLSQADSVFPGGRRQDVKSSSNTADGHTYVIAYPSVGVVKIGQSVYYAERVEQVVRHSPVPAGVVCAFVGLHHERELHKKFAHIRKHGELFEDCPELREHLSSRVDALTHEEAPKTSRFTRNRRKPRKSTR